MKKAQVSSKLLTYLLAIAIGLVIFYVIYLGATALFSAGRIYGVRECELKGEYDQARNLFDKDPKSDEAFKILQKVVSECKGTKYEHDSYRGMAEIHLNNQKYQDSISAYNRVFEYEGVRDEDYSSSAAKAQYNICVIYIYYLEDYDNALKECEKLSLYSYKNYDTYRYYHLGETYYKKGDEFFKQGNLEAAKEVYEKAKINFQNFLDFHKMETPEEKRSEADAKDKLNKISQQI
jgi:tetratricopeptide (TPR) repeat protein